MKKRMSIALLALGLAGCAGAMTGGDSRSNTPAAEKKEADEVKVNLQDCPPAVQATIRKEAAGGTIKETTKENEDGKEIYSADITLDGKPYEIEVSADGVLISKKLDTGEDESKSEKDENGEKGEKKGEHEDKD